MEMQILEYQTFCQNSFLLDLADALVIKRLVELLIITCSEYLRKLTIIVRLCEEDNSDYARHNSAAS